MNYKTKGVCSSNISFEVQDNKLTDLKFVGGCNGNLQGISKLCEGMDIDEIIAKLKGTTCGFKNTSCPDQLAQALEEYKNNN